MKHPPSTFSSFKRPGLTAGWAAALCIAAGCVLVDSVDRETAAAGETGHVRFDLGLEKSRSVLAKAAASDTVFTLDSLHVQLTAEGLDTVRLALAIDGRPDTGAIVLPPLTAELGALRNWKAVFRSIAVVDTVTRDTVHLDSVSFAVLPGDTAVVAKTVAPAFAILRARFLSDRKSTRLNSSH